MRELYSYGVLVVRGDPIDSFLLMQHPTRWDFPKGHIDAGETEVECALRELFEETGICSDDIQLDPDFRFSTSYTVQPKKFPGETCHKTTTMFLGRLIHDVEIRITEHLGFRWQKWDPPHAIQSETIDPCLAALDAYLGTQGQGPL